jgi:hypothetical protein
MHIDTITEVKKEAHAKWREYRNAEKTSKDPIYTDLKKMYWQMKHGLSLIDIGQVIQAGGVIKAGHPKLAVCRATGKKVECTYNRDGDVTYVDNLSGWRDKTASINIKGIFPKVTFSNTWQSSHRLEAPVPLIPPKHLPKKLTSNHYILWEVDEWKMIPPTDPYLLYRVTKNIFAVLRQWDLTPVEKAAMAGRMF